MTGETIIQWTIRSALAAWVAMLIARALGRPKSARMIWSLGLAAFLVHVWAVFHYVHQMSHAVAYEYTAQRTMETTGTAFGGGLYINYLFLAWWCADVIWWWLAEGAYLRRPKWYESLYQGFYLFIAFNSTVVFGTSPLIRWFGGVLTLAAIIGFWGLWLRSRHASTID